MNESSSLKTLGIGIVIVAIFWIGLMTIGSTRSQKNDSALDTQTLDSTNTQQLQIDPTNEGETMKQQKTVADFEPVEGNIVRFVTTKGNIDLELFTEQVPLTTTNFLTLVKDGFYDGIVFHRVIEGFMAQAGDPLTKDSSKQAMWGTGGPGYSIADEFVDSLKHDSAGILSMANAGPNTGGSQFFITFAPTPHLDGVHSVFGKVSSGMDVLMSIEQGDLIQSAIILE